MTRRVLTAAFSALLLMSSCAQPPEPMLPESTALVWPGSPEQARIAYVRSFSGAADLGIGRSLIQRLGALLFGDEELRLVRPMGVAVVGKILYVADPGARGVHRFDPIRSRHDLLRLPDGGALPSPVGIARGFDQEVYVTDSVLGRI